MIDEQKIDIDNVLNELNNIIPEILEKIDNAVLSIHEILPEIEKLHSINVISTSGSDWYAGMMRDISSKIDVLKFNVELIPTYSTIAMIQWLIDGKTHGLYKIEEINAEKVLTSEINSQTINCSDEINRIMTKMGIDRNHGTHLHWYGRDDVQLLYFIALE